MTALLTERELVFTVGHLCCGSGFGPLGFSLARAVHGRLQARFRTLFGLDVDPVACADFERIVGAPCFQVDLFDREQFIAFHGHEPPPGWAEFTAADLRALSGGVVPDVAFWSPPCKGLSSLLNKRAASSAKYLALNELVRRALDLALEAWADNLPALFLLENVPRIQTRGRELLDSIKLRLELAGYAVAETVHDCGELGGLAQHRQRFLLVARHRQKLRPFLYEPDRRPVRGVGEVIGSLPLPDDPRGGPMHKLPRLQWRTWVRLALIEAGSDWRSLNKLEVVDGHVRGLRLMPEVDWHSGVLGVRRWSDPSVTITGESLPGNGAFSVADPRAPRKLGDYQPYGVRRWDDASGTVTGQAAPGAGVFSVSDPRLPRQDEERARQPFSDIYRVSDWEQPSPTVTSGRGVPSIADPRPSKGWGGKGKYIPAAWDEPVGAVIAGSTTGQGAFVVADPRVGGHDEKRTPYNDVWRVVRWDEGAHAVTTGGTPSAGGQSVADPRVACKAEGGDYDSARHYGVLRWDETSPAITGSASHDNGAHSVADPRNPKQKCCPWIWSADGTRHRPFTTLELAALQGYPLDRILDLELGGKDSTRREHIGNGVPVPTAQAIGSTMLHTLLLQAAGQSFVLSAAPIWVNPQVALALSADLPVEGC